MSGNRFTAGPSARGAGDRCPTCKPSRIRSAIRRKSRARTVGDFVRLVIDTIQFAWPFRTVEKWERGLYVVCGRWIWEIDPGVYPIVWFFCRVIPVSMADAVL